MASKDSPPRAETVEPSPSGGGGGAVPDACGKLLAIGGRWLVQCNGANVLVPLACDCRHVLVAGAHPGRAVVGVGGGVAVQAARCPLHVSGGQWIAVRHVGRADGAWGTRCPATMAQEHTALQRLGTWVRGWPGWVHNHHVQHAGVEERTHDVVSKAAGYFGEQQLALVKRGGVPGASCIVVSTWAGWSWLHGQMGA